MKTKFVIKNWLLIRLETYVACTKTCTAAETWYRNASYQNAQELILNITSGNQYSSILIAIRKSMLLLRIFSVDSIQNNQKIRKSRRFKSDWNHLFKSSWFKSNNPGCLVLMFLTLVIRWVKPVFLAAISCSSDPSAQMPDVLLQENPPHKRARSAAWTYHFSSDTSEQSCSLNITLPTLSIVHYVEIKLQMPSMGVTHS